MTKIHAGIKGIRSYLAEGRLTNEMLEEEFPDWKTQAIYEKTGISVRGVSSPDECASDLGVAAANSLFDSGICQQDEIDFLLFCTQSPDYFLPTTACLMQDRLGLRNSCGALDFNLGCSGFVYGLSLAKGLIETGSASKVLLITADTYMKFINKTDRTVRTIFSDGASATLVAGMESELELIGPFVFGTDGKGAENLIVPAGGLRKPIVPETGVMTEYEGGILRSDENLYMNGPEILNFTLQMVPVLVEELLAKSQMTKEQVDYFVFHQANKFLLERLRRKTRIPEEKFCINMEAYGNTVSSTIPMALEIATQQQEIQSGNKVMIAGFGVGYSWAGAMIQIP
jgi:3-oxoacyl-[acyl-carrier-protein] synthase-3